MTKYYYRIQPAGKSIKNHYSETSVTHETGELADGLHVFNCPVAIFATDVDFEGYGDEVVVISAEESWENEDVEGVCVDPNTAKVVARYTQEEYCKLWAKAIAEHYPEAENLDWDALRYGKEYDLYDFAEDFEKQVKPAKRNKKQAK